MSKFIGRLTQIGIAKESTRGTAQSPTYWLEKTGLTFNNKSNLVKSAGSVGNIAAVTTGYITEQWAEGDIEGEIRDKSFGLILLATFGTVSSAASSGAYKHTYSLQNDNRHDSLSIAYKDPDNNYMFRRGMLGSLSINCRMDEIVSFTANFMSHVSEDWSSFTPSYVAENKFTKKHLTFKIASSIAGLSAASETSLKELTLTIEKPLVRDSVLGSVEPKDIFNTSFKITGTIVLNLDDNSFRTNAVDGTIKAMRIDLVNTDRTIGTTNPSFRIDLPKVIFEAWEQDNILDDIVGQTLTFEAYYEISNSRLWSDCYLKNEVASY